MNDKKKLIVEIIHQRCDNIYTAIESAVHLHFRGYDYESMEEYSLTRKSSTKSKT